MSDTPDPDPAAEAHEDGASLEGSDFTHDALPVLAGPPRILQPRSLPGALPSERRAVAMIPAVQAAAVAAGGFVAGAAVLGLVHRHQRRAGALSKGSRRAGRALGRAGTRSSRTRETLQIVGSRTLLLDVHLLGGTGSDR